MTTLKTSIRAAFSSGLLVAALLAPGAIVAPARAQTQSDSDLRKQNQELTTKVKDLEAELDAARKQNDALQKRVAALEAQLAARPATGSGRTPIPPLEEEKTTIDESRASASPRALLAAVTDSYKKAIADAPIGQAGDKDRIAYMRKLDKWKPITEREYRMPIDWVVRILPASMLDTSREHMATFVAVDPVTDVKLGDAFDIALSKSMAKRLSELDNRGELGLLAMKGTVVTGLSINPDRESRGAFDTPRFVGPFAEFGFTVEPTSITPYKPAAPATQPAAAPTTKP